jgi:predicted AAA+ superfamily ATPase
MLRDVESKVQQFLERRQDYSPVLIVQGARQVGKTYLVKQVLGKQSRQSISINLETDPSTKMAFDLCKDFDEFTKVLETRFGYRPGGSHVLYIDEAQESPGLGRFVRSMKEDWRDSKVVLSGSSMARMFSEEQRIPVGRITYLTVHPFSFREYLRAHELEERYHDYIGGQVSPPQLVHQQLLDLYDSYLLVGGLPEAVFSDVMKDDYRSILGDLLAAQRDDFLRKEKSKDFLFLDALKGIGNHVGSPAKYTHISGNHYDAKKIIDTMKKWFLVHEVEQKGSIPTQSFHPKWYLYDIGMLRFIRDTAIPSISIVHTVSESLRTPLGGIIENAVLLNMLQSLPNGQGVSTWKKNNKQDIEVDFIEKGEFETTPIEVKASLNPTPRHCKNILHYLEKTGGKSGILISLGMPQLFEQGDCKIYLTPAYSQVRRPAYLG